MTRREMSFLFSRAYPTRPRLTNDRTQKRIFSVSPSLSLPKTLQIINWHSSGVVMFAVSSYFSATVGAYMFLRLIRIAFPPRHPASRTYPSPGQRLHRQSGLLNSLASFCIEDFASTSSTWFLFGFHAIKVNSTICRERFLSESSRQEKGNISWNS